jgi:hypothetical protein
VEVFAIPLAVFPRIKTISERLSFMMAKNKLISRISKKNDYKISQNEKA